MKFVVVLMKQKTSFEASKNGEKILLIFFINYYFKCEFRFYEI